MKQRYILLILFPPHFFHFFEKIKENSLILKAVHFPTMKWNVDLVAFLVSYGIYLTTICISKLKLGNFMFGKNSH